MKGAMMMAQPVPRPRAAGTPRAAQPGRDAGPRRRPVREQHHRQPGGPDRDALSRQPGRARHRCQPDAAEQRGSALIQSRWSNGGARGIVVAVSSNGGNHWIQVVLPGVSKVSGGKYDRVSNAWHVVDGPTAPSTPLRSPSTSTRIPFSCKDQRLGGLRQQVHRRRIHLDAPTTIINYRTLDVAPNGDPELVFNDRDTVTADPTRPGFVYVVVWDRTRSRTWRPALFTGPAYFSMTTDGGRTWSDPEAINTPPVGAQTRTTQIVSVLPNGTLVDTLPARGRSPAGSLDAIRFTDHGHSSPLSRSPRASTRCRSSTRIPAPRSVRRAT